MAAAFMKLSLAVGLQFDNGQSSRMFALALGQVCMMFAHLLLVFIQAFASTDMVHFSCFAAERRKVTQHGQG